MCVRASERACLCVRDSVSVCVCVRALVCVCARARYVRARGECVCVCSRVRERARPISISQRQAGIRGASCSSTACILYCSGVRHSHSRLQLKTEA